MSFVLSFTRIGRVTQIVGARGFIKGASQVSFPSGPCMAHQHALRHSLFSDYDPRCFLGCFPLYCEI